jgi:hypothetical protein
VILLEELGDSNKGKGSTIRITAGYDLKIGHKIMNVEENAAEHRSD